MLGHLAYVRGDLVNATVWELKQNPFDPSDPEGPADLAIILDELGEQAAADTWLRESERRKPGNLMAASADVSLRYARGDRAGALTRALTLVPRRAEEHHDYWLNAVTFGCLAADELGRTPDMRAALVSANVLPADLAPASFTAWVGPNASPKVRLRELVALRRCVVTSQSADAPRRDQLRTTLAQVAGADWAAQDEWRDLAVELGNDGDAVVTYYLPRDTSVSRLPLRAGTAQMLGIANDARVVKHFAEQREQIAQMRAALPAALATDGLSMLSVQGR